MSSIGSAYKGIEELSAAAAAVGTHSFAVQQGVSEKEMTITQLATFMSTNLAAITVDDITITDGSNIILDTTTGTQIGTASGQKLGFYGVTPVNKGTALTTADAVALDATYNVTEQTTVSNMRVRINEMEVILTDLGLVN